MRLGMRLGLPFARGGGGDPIAAWALAHDGHDIDFGHAPSLTLRESGGVSYVTAISDRNLAAVFSQGTTASQPKLVADGTIGANVAYCDADYELTSDETAASWEWLHDASGLTALVVFSPGLVANPNVAYAIMGTKTNTGSQIGHYCSWDDRALVPINEAYRGIVGTATSVSAYVLTADGSLPVQTWNTLLLTLDATKTLRARANGGAGVADTAIENLGALGAPQHTLRLLGGLANVNNYRGYVARIVLIPSALAVGALNEGLAAVQRKYGIAYTEAT